jgi:hypothetical protein
MNANLEEQIKHWIIYDNQLKSLTDKIKEIRDKKTTLTTTIMKHISTNNLLNSTVQISDGKLRFINNKITTPLTFKYLEKSLGEIIKNDTQLKLIIEQIKSKREVSIIPEIKRIYNN